VTATTPISGSGTTPIATPASPANSPLADFLLGGSPVDTAQDFRAIAASLFGDAQSSPHKIGSLSKNPITITKTPVRLPDDKRQDRTAGKIPDPPPTTASPADPAVPLLTGPEPMIPVVSKAEPRPDTIGARQMSALLEGLTASRAQMENPEIANLAGDATPHTPLSGSLKESTTVADNSSTTTRDAGENLAPLTQLPTIAVGAKPGKEAAVRTGPELPIDLPEKKESEAAKSTNSGPRNQASNQASTGMSRQIPAQPGSMSQPPSPADAGTSPSPTAPLPQVATDSSFPVPALEQTSVASAKEILDNAITTKDALKSEPLALGAVAESEKAPGRAPWSGLAKVKDRGNSKDARAAVVQSGKPAPSQTGPGAGGLTPSGLSNGKDFAGATLPANAGAHAKPLPVKQAAGTPPPATALAETDGPDEALPTTGSSPVTTAKLVQNLSQSEFRVGMQSQEFGSIDIRTSVARHMFSAQISVEHSDMAKSLTADLPSLYGKLADQHVPVANIVIQGQSLATSSGLARDAQPQTWRPQSQGTTRSTTEPALPVIAESLDLGARLDIRI